VSDAIHYKFDFDGCPRNYFEVVSFEGEESISSLYCFTIQLRCEDPDVDPETMLDRYCWFYIYSGDQLLRKVSGCLRSFDEITQTHSYSIYQAELVPRLWQLNHYHTNEVYLDQTVPQVLETIFEDAQFTSLDYQFDFIRSYRSWEYRCQFNETHFNFVHRLIEREGIYYYFEQTDQGEKIIFCDNKQFHQKLPDPVFHFDPSSGLELSTFYRNVQSLVSRQQRLSKSMTLRDFNDKTPSVDIKGYTEIDAKGIGEINIWGLNIDSPDEGQTLAEIHADAIRCRKKVYHGESSAPAMIAGFELTLNRHFKEAFNQDYQVLSIHHEGADPRFFSASGSSESGTAMPDSYRNSFTAIAADRQYRPEIAAPKPAIHGTLNAVVDAEGDGQYAELDDQGRYKILLPFDRRDRNGGKASHSIRMMQPFGGLNEGMHFPLRKGARVLLSFIGGDPDRPIISGTMPDAEQPSVVTDKNQTNNMIRTAGGNKIEIEDREGSNRIKFETPKNQTYMHLGAANHGGDGAVLLSTGIERKDILGGLEETRVTKTVSESKSLDEIDFSSDDFEDKSALFAFKKKDTSGDGALASTLSGSEELSGNYLLKRHAGEQYFWHQGNQFVFYPTGLDTSHSEASKSFTFGCSWEIHYDRHGDTTEDEASTPSSMIGAMKEYALKGCVDFDGNAVGDDAEDWENYLNRGRVRLGHYEIFNFHEGNMYDFGDLVNYNMGNGYEENHMNDTEAEVNVKFPHDWLSEGGPGWESIAPPTGVFEKVSAPDLSAWSDATWVEKTFSGHKYEYSKDTPAIEISDGCDSIEVGYGGHSWEVKFNGAGQKVAESKSGGGKSEEWSWSPNHDFGEKSITDLTGVGKVSESWTYAYESPVSYEIVREPKPGTSFSFSGDGLPKLSMSMSVDVGETSLSTSIGVMSNEVSMTLKGMANSIEIDGTIMKNTVEISGAALRTKVEIGTGGLEELEANFGPLKARAEARALKMEQDSAVELMHKMLRMRKLAMRIDNAQIEVDAKSLGISQGFLKMFC
jgi:type VI secretion system secreted protein VgrG